MNNPGCSIIVKELRTSAFQYGSVKLFKAYTSVSQHGVSPYSLALRSELQSAGVSIIDCPHNGSK
jgi:hypothetical protein